MKRFLILIVLLVPSVEIKACDKTDSMGTREFLSTYKICYVGGFVAWCKR